MISSFKQLCVESYSLKMAEKIKGEARQFTHRLKSVKYPCLWE